MELILLERVQNLGELGDKVNVKPGYGRNYLVPGGKAVPASKENIAHFEARRAELEKAELSRLSTAEKRSTALADVVVSITANASEEGKLYGSIGPREISEALELLGHEVSKSEVLMGDGPIRNTGEFAVVLSLHADIETSIQVVVSPE